MTEDVKGRSYLTYEATCLFDGFADVSIFVFVGEGFDAEQRTACLVPHKNSKTWFLTTVA